MRKQDTAQKEGGRWLKSTRKGEQVEEHVRSSIKR